ncbi:hypothetical protein DFH06DRAFT_1139382 [Mycena polygramma]|nr:hypothetical protein DFH06DRAFT_1139382 [Mycena polygramma]
MPRAWLGLKARAWAWLGRALAWESSSPSPSPPAGLGLAWLGPRPGLEHRNFFRMLETDHSPGGISWFWAALAGVEKGGNLGLKVALRSIETNNENLESEMPGLAGLAWLKTSQALGPGPCQARRRAWLGSGLSGLGFRA